MDYDQRILELKQEFNEKQNTAEFQLQLRKEAIKSTKEWLAYIAEDIEINDSSSFEIRSIDDTKDFIIKQKMEVFIMENLKREDHRNFYITSIIGF